MIRTLRVRHRVIWLALAVLLPLLFAAALRARHAEPRLSTAHPELVSP